MKGKNLLSYEMIVKAANGNPGATEVVLEHYAGYIRYVLKMDGCFDLTKNRVKNKA